MTANAAEERSRFITGVVISVTGALCFSTKAVFVKLGYRDGGAERVVTLLARTLRARGEDVSVISLGPPTGSWPE